MKNKPQILHLIPHLGGGVGTVFRSYVTYEANLKRNEHKVAVLDYLNTETANLFNDLNIEWEDNIFYNLSNLYKMIEISDIVLIHWWNHPLLQEILMNNDLPQSRIIIWSHISGNVPPNNFNNFILNFPDKFIFTTPLSFKNEYIINKTIPDKEFFWIWSTAGIEKLIEYTPDKKSLEDNELIIGYTGNLDYAKLDMNFLKICKQLLNLKLKIQIIGPLTEEFKKDLDKYDLKNKILVTDYITESEKFNLMKNFDIFMYPLSRNHYGTCDQALQEAMYFGAVPVVLDNDMENFMVTHGKNGLVAQNDLEIIEFVNKLVDNPEFRGQLSMNASKDSKEKYKISHMSDLWQRVFVQVFEYPKKNHASLSKLLGRKLDPNEVFSKSLGKYGEIFELYKETKDKNLKNQYRANIKKLGFDSKWTSPTKSSPSHYFQYFPNDLHLLEWTQIINRR